MSLNERITRLEIELGTGDLFGAYTLLDVGDWGYFGVPEGEVPRYELEEPPIELEWLVVFASFVIAPGILQRPTDRIRALEETKRADEFRRQHGQPPTLTPDRIRDRESEIEEAQQEAAALRESLGLPPNGFDPQWLEGVADEAGLPESVIEALRLALSEDAERDES
jgi:hypothetical protein